TPGQRREFGALIGRSPKDRWSTTADAVQPVHDWMPVILPPARFDAWLAPQTSKESLLEMLQPYQGELSVDPVSTWVNSPKHDDPRCREGAEATESDPLDFFFGTS